MQRVWQEIKKNLLTSVKNMIKYILFWMCLSKKHHVMN